MLIASTLGLVPRQSSLALGLEFLTVGGVGVLSVSWIRYRDRHHRNNPVWLLVQVLTSQLPVIPFVISGALLLRGADAALYGLVLGAIFSFAAGVLNAWVLLVEILR